MIISSIVTQSGNGYRVGFVESFWQPVWAYGREQTRETEAAVPRGLTLESIRGQYLTGVPDQSVVSPETLYHDSGLVSRPGNDRVQLALNRDYMNNISFYPKLHEHLRTSEVPVLAIWGESDPIFGPAGASAFVRDSSVVRRSTCFPADRWDAVLEIVNCLRLIDPVFLL